MRLSDSQLEGILEGIEAATSPVEALVGALRETFLALGAGDLSEPGGPKIDGRDFPLAASQWKAIGDALIRRGDRLVADGGLEAVNLGLDWMNYGPSGEPEDELAWRDGSKGRACVSNAARHGGGGRP